MLGTIVLLAMIGACVASMGLFLGLATLLL